jgi:hypothetical protein
MIQLMKTHIAVSYTIFVALAFGTTTTSTKASDTLKGGDLVALIQKNNVPLGKKIQALALAARLEMKFDNDEASSLKNFLLKTILAKDTSKEDIEELFKHFKKLGGLHLDKNEVAQYRDTLLNPNTRFDAIPILFEVLYCNGYYTSKNQKGLIESLKSLTRKQGFPPKNIAEINILLLSTTPCKIPADWRFPDKMSYAQMSNEIEKFKEQISADNLLKRILSACEIATANESIFTATIKLDDTFLANNWPGTIAFLYYGDIDYPVLAPKMFDAISKTIKNNLNAPPLMRAIFSGLGSKGAAIFTAPLFRNHLQLLKKGMATPGCEPYAKRIADLLTSNDSEHLDAYIADKTLIERRFFDKISHHPEDAPSFSSDHASLMLELIASIYTDFKLPDDLRKHFPTSYEKNSNPDIISILLIQNNPAYALEQKKLALALLSRFDSLPDAMKLTLCDAISHHLINNARIRAKCLEFLDDPPEISDPVALIWMFRRIDSNRKEVAMRLLSFYEKLISKPEFTKNHKRLKELRNYTRDTLNTILDKTIQPDLDAWKKAIQAMPEDRAGDGD